MNSKKIELVRKFMSVGQDEKVEQHNWSDFTIDYTLLTVLHESEFLKAVCECIEGGANIDHLEVDFLVRTTGVSENVFELLGEQYYQYEHSQTVASTKSLASIIANTKGVIETAKLALDYYGINHFMSISRGEPARKTDDGFYLWVNC